MAIYDENKKPIVLPEFTDGMDAARKFRSEHATELVATNPQYDKKGFFLRKEDVVQETQTFKVTQYSDGTTRVDSHRAPAPPKPAVTAQTEMRYTAEDMAQLRSTEGKATVQVSEKGMQVSGPAVEVPSRPSRGPWEPQRPYVPRSE